MTVDFPPNCGHCGWQLHPPVAWLNVVTFLATHPSKAPGLTDARALVGAELARARLAYPQESAAEKPQEGAL